MLGPSVRTIRRLSTSFLHLRRLTFSNTIAKSKPLTITLSDNSLSHFTSSFSSTSFQSASVVLHHGISDDVPPYSDNDTASARKGEEDEEEDTALLPRYNTASDAYSAIQLSLDSVVKIFTVSSSPNYFLPWQNKSQRETMGSGISQHVVRRIPFGFITDTSTRRERIETAESKLRSP